LRQRQLVVQRQHERRPVRQHAAARLQRQLAKGELLVVELQAGEAPRIRAQARHARLQLRLQVTVMLLQVLGLQQHALGPDDFTIPRHGVSLVLVLLSP
jgi:hypothetical protein